MHARVRRYALEAFFYSEEDSGAGGGGSRHAEMAMTHKAFLGWYGLTAAEVPLLRYRCSQIDTSTWDHERQRSKVPVRDGCFVDVS